MQQKVERDTNLATIDKFIDAKLNSKFSATGWYHET